MLKRQLRKSAQGSWVSAAKVKTCSSLLSHSSCPPPAGGAADYCRGPGAAHVQGIAEPPHLAARPGLAELVHARGRRRPGEHCSVRSNCVSMPATAGTLLCRLPRHVTLPIVCIVGQDSAGASTLNLPGGSDHNACAKAGWRQEAAQHGQQLRLNARQRRGAGHRRQLPWCADAADGSCRRHTAVRAASAARRDLPGGAAAAVLRQVGRRAREGAS